MSTKAKAEEILLALGLSGFPANAADVINDAAAMDALAQAAGTATRTVAAPDEAAIKAADEAMSAKIDAAVAAKLDAAVAAKFEAMALRVTDIAAKTAAIEAEARAATASVARAGETLTQIKGMVSKAIGVGESPVKSEPIGDEQKKAIEASKKAEEDAKGGAGKTNRSESGAVIYARG